ncbi:MAG: hypothetical protein U1E05_01925 [Patescibacteria group bacterium]|nr:hypothetical protein [Patescibacteria group bacterium]
MIRTIWAFAVFCAVLHLTINGATALAQCVTCEGGPAAGFSAPACRGPMYGAEPGCCEFAPSACDNAWDGFCQEKLKWKQFWSKVGTGYRVPPRTGQPARGMTAGMLPSSSRAVEFHPTSMCTATVGEQETILPPTTKEELPPGFGPPPLPEPMGDPMGEPSLTPEPRQKAPSPPGQSRMPWEYHR